MIPLLRVGHAAAGQKRPAQERRPTALFFKQRKVQVQRKMRPAIVAERAPDRVELVLLRDAEDELAAVLRLVREFVKAQGKCLLEELREDDLLILTADHGNDPTYSGTDHTREYVPFLAYSKTMKEGGPLENEDTFSVIGASVADNFDVKMPEGTIGHSILEKLC